MKTVLGWREAMFAFAGGFFGGAVGSLIPTWATVVLIVVVGFVLWRR